MSQVLEWEHSYVASAPEGAPSRATPARAAAIKAITRLRDPQKQENMRSPFAPRTGR